MAAVKVAQAQQPAQNVCQVAAEYAAVGMNFIDHDVLQVFKQLDPFGVMRQNTAVQHIGIRDDNVPRLAHRLAGRSRRIPVVGIGFDIDADFLDHVVKLADLIGGKRFCRKNVERPGVLVLQDRGKHRKIVAHGFPGGGRRHDRNVFPPVRGLEAADLMNVQLVDPAAFQRRLQPPVHAGGKRRRPCPAGGNHFPPGHVLHEHAVLSELIRQLRYVHPVVSLQKSFPESDNPRTPFLRP